MTEPSKQPFRFEPEAKKPRVYVFGGGIAGLTAAHELVTRGFDVTLYERDLASGPQGKKDVGLGGLARTQYFPAFIERTTNVLAYHSVDDKDAQLQAAFKRFLEAWKKEPIPGILARPPLCTALNQLFERLAEELLRAPPDEALHAVESALKEVLVGELRHNYMSLLASGPDSVGLPRDPALRPHNPGQPPPRHLTPHDYARALAQALAGEPTLRLVERFLSTPQLPEPVAASLGDVLRIIQRVAPRQDSLREWMERNKDFARKVEQLPQPPFIVALGPEAPSQPFEFWFEFKEETLDWNEPVLTDRSLEELKDAAFDISVLFALGELGRKEEIVIHVQEFAKPMILPLPPFPPKRTLAKVVTRHLQEALAFDELHSTVVEFPEAPSQPAQPPTASRSPSLMARRWVRVFVYRPMLPGEHGYRFFPSFYRHVFETLRHIPLQDLQGQPQPGTVLDNLVPVPQIGFLSNDSPPFMLGWEPPRAGEMLALAEYGRLNMRELGITSQDLFQYSLRVLRYMTTSSQRRARELEGLSWWQYLEGWSPGCSSPRYEYSKEFKHLVQSSSRVLAALDGRQGDARTCGNVYVQLLTEALVPTRNNNSTLNGPTSEAWFHHWYHHLRRLGVKIEHGELTGLEVKQGRLVAHVKNSRLMKDEFEVPKAKDGEHVYFVVATDLLSAAAVTQGLRQGLIPSLHEYANQVPEQPGSPRLVERDPEREPGTRPWDRLQTISGIQYFFEKHLNVVDGYMYCVDAEWGLSAICSHQVWQVQPSERLSRYQSILSVDIGEWRKPSRHLGKTAWECTPEELKNEVLRQLRKSLETRGPGEGTAVFVLPEPDWVHIDEGLEYSQNTQRLLRNKTPYLVPVVGDWAHRPGPEPWNPTPHTPPPPPWHSPNGAWQARHGGYPVHYDRLVFAGTWLKTFTRLTTMESANESARHAVNAILDHCTWRLKREYVQPQRQHTQEPPSALDPYEKGLYPTTPFGDYCRIWDPERNELPDLEFLQKMDEEKFRRGLDHPWDVLGLERLPALLSRTPLAWSAWDALLDVVATFGRRTAPQAVQGLVAVLNLLRRKPGEGRPAAREDTAAQR